MFIFSFIDEYENRLNISAEHLTTKPDEINFKHVKLSNVNEL